MYTYHVECNDIFERDLSCFVCCHENLVDLDGGRACWEAKDEGVFFGRAKCNDPICGIVRKVVMRGEDIPIMYWAM